MRRWLLFAALFGLLGLARAGDDAAATNQAKQLYEVKCAKCHPFRDPAAYDDATWSRWMDKMRDKARLTDAQYDRLAVYLQTLRHASAKKR